MKKVSLILLVFSVFLYADSFKISLVEFVDILKTKTNKTFILNEKLENENIYLVVKQDINNLKLSELESILKRKDLKLFSYENYYYIDYKNKEFDNELKLRAITLKNNSYAYVKKIIDLYNLNNSNSFNKKSDDNYNTQNNIKFVDYIETTNTIIFLCKDDDYVFLENEITQNDKILNTATLKITITETNLNKLKSTGVKYKSLTKIIDSINLKTYLNLFTASSENSLISSNKAFYTFIDFLSEKNITKIKASPFLTIKNNVNTTFSIVENIPYLTKNESIENDKKTESNSYEYKDVGLKIDIKPLILNDKIDFDLNITIEDILDNNTLTPRTSKKTLKGSYVLNKNEILILSGINKDTEYKNNVGIPILKEIPILKHLFSYDYKSNLKTSLLITIEYLNDDNKNQVTTKNNNEFKNIYDFKNNNQNLSNNENFNMNFNDFDMKKVENFAKKQ